MGFLLDDKYWHKTDPVGAGLVSRFPLESDCGIMEPLTKRNGG